MRVRVQFRFNAETGMVEMFRVEETEGVTSRDHDARHDAVTRDVARVIDPHARIIEEVDAPVATARTPDQVVTPAEPTPEPPQRERQRNA
jgi:hypothetical protein